MLAHLYFRRIYINYEINNYANVFSIKNRQGTGKHISFKLKTWRKSNLCQPRVSADFQ